MDKEKLLEIIKEVEYKSNKDLLNAEEYLFSEHEKVKSLIIDLTHHLESVEKIYYRVTDEIIKRQQS